MSEAFDIFRGIQAFDRFAKFFLYLRSRNVYAPFGLRLLTGPDKNGIAMTNDIRER